MNSQLSLCFIKTLGPVWVAARKARARAQESDAKEAKLRMPLDQGKKLLVMKEQWERMRSSEGYLHDSGSQQNAQKQDGEVLGSIAPDARTVEVVGGGDREEDMGKAGAVTYLFGWLKRQTECQRRGAVYDWRAIETLGIKFVNGWRFVKIWLIFALPEAVYPGDQRRLV